MIEITTKEKCGELQSSDKIKSEKLKKRGLDRSTNSYDN